uniref:Uncharacterized protein n=1 Tax=Oryza barthii TaxID=65489 RepID=A0A0D3HBR2_9ORYZ
MAKLMVVVSRLRWSESAETVAQAEVVLGMLRHVKLLLVFMRMGACMYGYGAPGGLLKVAHAPVTLEWRRRRQKSAWRRR